MTDFTKEEDRSLHLRLPPNLYEDIKAAAWLADVPVNWWIIKTLDKVLGITGREPRPRQIR